MNLLMKLIFIPEYKKELKEDEIGVQKGNLFLPYTLWL